MKSHIKPITFDDYPVWPLEHLPNFSWLWSSFMTFRSPTQRCWVLYWSTFLPSFFLHFIVFVFPNIVSDGLVVLCWTWGLAMENFLLSSKIHFISFKISYYLLTRGFSLFLFNFFSFLEGLYGVGILYQEAHSIFYIGLDSSWNLLLLSLIFLSIKMHMKQIT